MAVRLSPIQRIIEVGWSLSAGSFFAWRQGSIASRNVFIDSMTAPTKIYDMAVGGVTSCVLRVYPFSLDWEDDVNGLRVAINTVTDFLTAEAANNLQDGDDILIQGNSTPVPSPLNSVFEPMNLSGLDFQTYNVTSASGPTNWTNPGVQVRVFRDQGGKLYAKTPQFSNASPPAVTPYASEFRNGKVRMFFSNGSNHNWGYLDWDPSTELWDSGDWKYADNGGDNRALPIEVGGTYYIPYASGSWGLCSTQADGITSYTPLWNLIPPNNNVTGTAMRGMQVLSDGDGLFSGISAAAVGASGQYWTVAKIGLTSGIVAWHFQAEGVSSLVAGASSQPRYAHEREGNLYFPYVTTSNRAAILCVTLGGTVLWTKEFALSAPWQTGFNDLSIIDDPHTDDGIACVVTVSNIGYLVRIDPDGNVLSATILVGWGGVSGSNVSQFSFIKGFKNGNVYLATCVVGAYTVHGLFDAQSFSTEGSADNVTFSTHAAVLSSDGFTTGSAIPEDGVGTLASYNPNTGSVDDTTVQRSAVAKVRDGLNRWALVDHSNDIGAFDSINLIEGGTVADYWGAGKQCGYSYYRIHPDTMDFLAFGATTFEWPATRLGELSDFLDGISISAPVVRAWDFEHGDTQYGFKSGTQYGGKDILVFPQYEASTGRYYVYVAWLGNSSTLRPTDGGDMSLDKHLEIL